MATSPNQPFAVHTLERQEIDRAYREVFATQSGKLVLFSILSECSVYAEAYAGEKTAATNYALGRQKVGRGIIDRLDSLDPKYYPQLLLSIGEFRENLNAVAKADIMEEGEETDVQA